VVVERSIVRFDLLPANAVLAANRIGDYVRETPLEYSPFFSELTGANVYLKLENLQHTSSFKLRGAFNKLLSMSPEETEAGCVTASSGNHGAAIAYAMQKLGINGIVFVPEGTTSTKVDSIKRAGGDVRFFGTDGLETEQHARQYAMDNGMQYLSPYNDLDVIAGQGSCGVEIARQIGELDAIFVAVGGGGLISGVGSFLRSIYPALKIIGCQPQASAVMAASAKAGEIVEMASEPTLSDGTAGGIEAGAVTFDICQRLVDHYVLVSEEEIAEAMREFIDSHHQLLEGAAGVAIAALKKEAADFQGKNVVIIICGGNISRETLRKVI
jgi:threonine dehydratase